MKYVRTEDYILEFAKYDEARNKATDLGLTYCKKIIKSADTIEKLLDNVVVVDTHGCSPAVLRRFLGDFCLDGWLEDSKREDGRYQFFGSIWTGEGLIYVAKMNEQGEWVLI